MLTVQGVVVGALVDRLPPVQVVVAAEAVVEFGGSRSMVSLGAPF